MNINIEIVKDSFNKVKHSLILEKAETRLKECDINLTYPITRITISPDSIQYMDSLVYVQSKKGDMIIRNDVSITVDVRNFYINIHDTNNAKTLVELGTPTIKGYKSKVWELEDFVIDQNLNISTDSIEKLIKFIHPFKIWKK